MARQRVLKPSFNDDDDIAALSFPARLFYAVLWEFLDKQALIEENALALRSKLYPREDFPVSLIEGWLSELTTPGPGGRPRIVRVTWRGKKLLYVPTLKRHSRIFVDEPEYFKVPASVLKEAREACGIYIDEDGNPVDPPAPPPASPSGSHVGSTEQPNDSHVDPSKDPRGSPVGPTELPPNSHDSAPVPAPASVPASASSSSSAPAPAGGAGVENSAHRVDNSSETSGNGNGSSGRGLTQADPLAWLPPEEKAKILKLDQELKAGRDRGG